MLIDWARRARADLLDISDYLTQLGEGDVAKKIVDSLIKSTDILINFPLSGRIGRIDGTRELVHTKYPYIIVYRVEQNNVVYILRVLHTSRLFPEIL
jgi:toxin ParE1/3/4